MAKGKSTKREFDWRTYTKPARLLTEDQEQAFARGELAPLLKWALQTPGARFEIRARQAAIYHNGTLLLRIRGAEPPFLGEIDANVRLPRADRAGAETPRDLAAFHRPTMSPRCSRSSSACVR